MQSGAVVSISTTVREAVRLPFVSLASSVLPRGYELSLVICGDTLAARMNREWRNKTYTPNVLSFPLSKAEGEIFLNVREAEREAKKMGIRTTDRLAHLFVHGCAHLRGLAHGRAMDALEARILREHRYRSVFHE